MENPKKSLPPGPRAGQTNVSRRRFLAGGAAGLAALAAGAGNALGSTSRPDEWPWQNGQRRYAGKTVLITGATSGIGEATARAFAAEGANVFFCGRRQELGEQIAQSIREQGGTATFHRADVREEAQVRRFVESCLETYGGLDIAFNNAGIEGPEGAIPEVDLTGEQSYRDVFRTNTDGVFFAMRHEIPAMISRGGGVIINTASVQGSRGSEDTGPYSASKHAVIGLTRSAALAHARDNIRILSVSPGPVETDLLRRMYEDLSEIARENPSGRIALPVEIAAMVLTLAAPEASFLHGDDVKVDGGSSA